MTLTDAFQPYRIIEAELSQPLQPVTVRDPDNGQRYERAVVLVRLHTQPLGMMEIQFSEPGLSPDEFAGLIWSALRQEINAHLRADGLPAVETLSAAGLAALDKPECQRERAQVLENAPFVSVVIATRDRADSLSTCLDAVLAMAYPNFEVIVVDNAPATTATADLIQQNYADRVCYTREDRPGLGRAHNRGLKEVRADIVAFTDDDVIVDKYWLVELVKGFYAEENVGCVTGMIFAAELDTPAQLWIEQYGGFNKGFARRVFDLKNYRVNSPLYPYTAGVFGSGASMAFTTAALKAIGDFDPALGAGTAALGGDDLAAFFHVVAKGYRLVYEPGALLYHRHRRDYAGLQRQAYGYGVGLTAYLTQLLMHEPARLLDFAIRLPSGIRHIFSPNSSKNAKKCADYPAELNTLERRGMLYGPLAYWRSRRQSR